MKARVKNDAGLPLISRDWDHRGAGAAPDRAEPVAPKEPHHPLTPASTSVPSAPQSLVSEAARQKQSGSGSGSGAGLTQKEFEARIIKAFFEFDRMNQANAILHMFSLLSPSERGDCLKIWELAKEIRANSGIIMMCAALDEREGSAKTDSSPWEPTAEGEGRAPAAAPLGNNADFASTSIYKPSHVVGNACELATCKTEPTAKAVESVVASCQKPVVSVIEGHYLTIVQAAAKLTICRRTLEREIEAGRFPRPRKIRGRLVVSQDDVRLYMWKLLKRPMKGRAKQLQPMGQVEI